MEDPADAAPVGAPEDTKDEPTTNGDDVAANGDAADAKEEPRKSRDRSHGRSRSSRERRDRSRRDRSRSKDRRRRRSRSRSRSGGRSRHRRRHRRHRRRSPSSSRSRSRSRSRHRRRRNKKSNFDVRPDMFAAAAAAAAGGADGEGAGTGAAPVAGMLGAMQRNMMYNPMMMQQMMGMRPMVSNQQTRHARRLYCGGCGDTTEDEMKEFFTQAVKAAVKFDFSSPPVLSVYVNQQRKFCFVEFASIELATACMQLDGILFRGNPVRIRRPNDYQPQRVPPSVIPPLEVDLSKVQIGGPGGGGGGIPASKDRIFIGGVPYTMSDDQVREIFAAFGALKDLQMIKDNGQPKGYGFCQYMDSAITDKAIEALNGIRIGDRELTVRRANPPGSGRQTQAQNAMGMMPGMMPQHMLMQQQMMMQQQQAAMNPALAGVGGAGVGGGAGAGAPGPVGAPPPGPATRVVVLANMVTPAELADDVEYREIKEDVEDECGKYGAVKAVKMPRPGESGCGKVFVEFVDLQGAQKAAAAINNRRFGPHTVSTTYYSEAEFAAGQLA